MTITDTRTDQALADPVTYAMAFLKSPSQATRFDAVQLLSLSGFHHANLSLIPLYHDWYAHPTGIALEHAIDLWFIAAANQLYGNADLPYSTGRTFRVVPDDGPICPVPHRRQMPAWVWLLIGALGGAIGGIVAAH